MPPLSQRTTKNHGRLGLLFRPQGLYFPSLPSRPPTSEVSYTPTWATWARRGSALSVIMASSLPMEKKMDATQQTFPLLNGEPAILSYFLSFDPTLKSHPQRATGMHGLPIAVGGSLASAVPRSVYILLPAPHRAALEGFYSPLPPPTPTSAPHRPASDLADALGLAGPSTTAPFTVVLEAVRGAPIDALAEVLVLCPAASPASSTHQ